MKFRLQEVSFYVGFNYIASKRAFILYVFTANPVVKLTTYKCKMFLEEPESVNALKLHFDAIVLPIEKHTDIGRNMQLAEESYWQVWILL